MFVNCTRTHLIDTFYSRVSSSVLMQVPLYVCCSMSACCSVFALFSTFIFNYSPHPLLGWVDIGLLDQGNHLGWVDFGGPWFRGPGSGGSGFEGWGLYMYWEVYRVWLVYRLVYPWF